MSEKRAIKVRLGTEGGKIQVEVDADSLGLSPMEQASVETKVLNLTVDLIKTVMEQRENNEVSA